MGDIKASASFVLLFCWGSDARNSISGDPRISVGSRGRGCAGTDVGLFGSII